MARYGNNHKGGRPPRAIEQKRLEAIHRAGEDTTGNADPYFDLWKAVWRIAIHDGNIQAIRMILEYAYGKPRPISEHQEKEAPILIFTTTATN